MAEVQAVAGTDGSSVPPNERRRLPRSLRNAGALAGCTCQQLLSTLARLGAPVRLYDAHGMLQFESSAFSRLLPSGNERRKLLENIAALVRGLHATQSAATATRNAKPSTISTSHEFLVMLRGSRVRFCAAPLCINQNETQGLLVLAQHAGHEPLTDMELRRQFKLTAQEVRVARLIAEGHRTPELAGLLTISVHTARRHSERLLKKMGVRSRSLVRAALAK